MHFDGCTYIKDTWAHYACTLYIRTHIRMYLTAMYIKHDFPKQHNLPNIHTIALHPSWTQAYPRSHTQTHTHFIVQVRTVWVGHEGPLLVKHWGVPVRNTVRHTEHIWEIKLMQNMNQVVPPISVSLTWNGMPEMTLAWNRDRRGGSRGLPR